MTCGLGTWEPAAAAAVDAFRGRVREVLGAFSPDEMAQWDKNRHLPASALAEIGRRGIFRERWERGAEGGLPWLVALSEEASLRNSGLALAVMGHSEIFIGALQWLAGGEAQQALLDQALDGKVVGCFAATEAHGGSSLAAIRTTAAAAGDGWRLSGCKRYVSNAGGASHVLVLARPRAVRQAGDLNLFVVPLGGPGVIIDGFFGVSGVSACDLGQITFDADLPREALLGRPGLGLLYASYLLTFERISICAQLLASAEAALRLTVAYARQRMQGPSRLIDSQVVRHRLARCQAELWNLQTWLRDLTSRAQQQNMPAHEVAALKLMAGESAGRIADTCVQLFGARGCTRNFPVERFWRDCRLARLGGGTDEVLADLVASGLDRPDPETETLLRAYLAEDMPALETGPRNGAAGVMAPIRPVARQGDDGASDC